MLKLLEWSWNTFHAIAQDMDMSRGTGHLGAITDLQKLVYICRACLRLLKIFITEVYPDGGRSFVKSDKFIAKILFFIFDSAISRASGHNLCAAIKILTFVLVTQILFVFFPLYELL